MGRPTDYKPNFHPEDFIRLSKQGKTICQIAAIWDIDESTFHRWTKRHKLFSMSVKKGQFFCQAWWMDVGTKAMFGEMEYKDPVTGKVKMLKVNLGFYVWLTKNLLKWSDKMDYADFKGIKKYYDELNKKSTEELAKEAAKLAKKSSKNAT